MTGTGGFAKGWIPFIVQAYTSFSGLQRMLHNPVGPSAPAWIVLSTSCQPSCHSPAAEPNTHAHTSKMPRAAASQRLLGIFSPTHTLIQAKCPRPNNDISSGRVFIMPPSISHTCSIRRHLPYPTQRLHASIPHSHSSVPARSRSEGGGMPAFTCLSRNETLSDGV